MTGINFQALVLAPAMATFAKPVTITPLQSEPNAAPYPARGIWSIASTTIIGDGGNPFSTVNLKFGIMFSDYPFVPSQGDWITSTSSDLPLGFWEGQLIPSSNIDFIIDNVTSDGQGGAMIDVKRVLPITS